MRNDAVTAGVILYLLKASLILFFFETFAM
jgi:hypothetical protein